MRLQILLDHTVIQLRGRERRYSSSQICFIFWFQAQNRLAATRYREKKRKEKEERMNMISELLTRNEDLKKQVSSMESEVNVLKKLMNELGVRF